MTFLRKIDWFLVIPTVLLVLTSILLIYSASWGKKDADIGNTYRQIVFIAIGLALMFFLTFVDYSVFKNYSRILYLIMFLSLIAVLFFGDPVRGARSWFSIGTFGIQPAEFAKFACIIVLAKYFSINKDEMFKFKHILISGLYVLIPILLIALQPDLGSALVIFIIWLSMLLMTRVKFWHILALMSALVSFAFASWKFLLRSYQKERVSTFLDPNIDPLGTGYNVTQAKIAIGSGGIFGKGLGQGSQSQLNFLPEQHTDFIFAVLSEELGFFGGLLLLSFFGLLLFKIFKIARYAKDHFGMMLGIGIGVMILFQLVVNIGMNLGLLPVTGIPLPLVSYGGSSMIVMLASLGVVMSISRKERRERIKSVEEL